MENMKRLSNIQACPTVQAEMKYTFTKSFISL